MTVLPPKKRTPAIDTSGRCTLVSLEFVRCFRGCDAVGVLYSVGDACSPGFLRWVFNVAVKADSSARRELRFWKDEVMHPQAVDQAAQPETVVDLILGDRLLYSRNVLEVQWTMDATTISRLVRRRELAQQNWKITRASLAAFLLRRLQ